MRVFGVEMTQAMVDAIAEHGEADYPNEACGLVLGENDAPRLVRAVRLRNVQDKYHQLDPEQFPRTARDAFRLDELERMRVLDAADAEARVERILYHSHPDAGAYFSPEDRAAAIQDGIELNPGVINLVVSIRSGKRADMAAFLYDASRNRFDEVRIPLILGAAPELPDLELRAMEGGESALPIVPVGRGLSARRVSPDEQRMIEAMAEHRVAIAEARVVDIDRFGRGLLSPLTGFLRSGELNAIEANGRLLSGTDWRVPIALDVAKSAVAFESGALIELVTPGGDAVAALGVSVLAPLTGGRVRLGGPLYVYPTDGLDAAQVRAELLRRGWRRIVAIPKCAASMPLDRSAFDGVLDANSHPPLLLEVGDGGWLDAAMAQNQGATHIVIPDPAVRRVVTETLAITAVAPASD